MEGTVEKRAVTSVRSLGDLMQRLDEIDEETYDKHVDTKRTQQRISNNRQRLEIFKLAFRAGILKTTNDQLMLPAPAPEPVPVPEVKAEAKAA